MTGLIINPAGLQDYLMAVTLTASLMFQALVNPLLFPRRR